MPLTPSSARVSFIRSLPVSLVERCHKPTLTLDTATHFLRRRHAKGLDTPPSTRRNGSVVTDEPITGNATRLRNVLLMIATGMILQKE